MCPAINNNHNAEETKELEQTTKESDTKTLIEQLTESSLEQAGAAIFKDTDGVLYWIHKVNLYLSGTHLFLVMKIFFFIWLVLALFLIGVTAFDDGLNEALSSIGPPMLWVLLFLIALVTLSYYFYAVMMGGRYSVLFRMDEKGVSHTQLPHEHKRAQALGAVTILAGLLSRNASTAGTGMLSSGHSSVYTRFTNVSNVKASPRRYTIKLRSGLMHNQVYTAPEDFDFVLAFIRDHIGKHDA